MRQITNNKLLQKILCSLILLITIFNFCGSNFVWAAPSTMTLNEYILSVVKTWADEGGNIKEYIFSDQVSYVNINDIDIDYFWNTSVYDTYGNGEAAVFENKARGLIDDIIKVLKKDYEKSDGLNQDLDLALYHLISDRGEESKGFLGFGKKEAYNNGDNITVKASGTTIISIDLSALEGTEHGWGKHKIVKKDETTKEEETETISEGIYKYTNGKYFCTYVVAAQVWDEESLKDTIKNILLKNNNGQSFDIEEIIAKYGDKIENIKIFFQQIDENKKPTGNEPTAMDMLINIDLSNLREEVTQEDIEEIREGIKKYKNGRYFCTYNVGITAWDEQYIKEEVKKQLETICLNQPFDFEGIIEKYGDDLDKIKIYFDEIDSNKNPIGDNPKSEDIKVNIPREELLDANLTDYWDRPDSADVGGVLLSPIFYLVNFVADAITSVLGDIMMGNNINIFGRY